MGSRGGRMGGRGGTRSGRGGGRGGGVRGGRCVAVGGVSHHVQWREGVVGSVAGGVGNTKRSHFKESTPSTSSSLSARYHGVKEKVKGARRVWGTMSLCSVSLVKNAIERFCGISTIKFVFVERRALMLYRHYTLVVCTA